MLVYVICIIAPFFWQSLVSLVANNNKTKNKKNPPLVKFSGKTSTLSCCRDLRRREALEWTALTPLFLRLRWIFTGKVPILKKPIYPDKTLRQLPMWIIGMLYNMYLQMNGDVFRNINTRSPWTSVDRSHRIECTNVQRMKTKTATEQNPVISTWW